MASLLYCVWMWWSPASQVRPPALPRLSAPAEAAAAASAGEPVVLTPRTLAVAAPAPSRPALRRKPRRLRSPGASSPSGVDRSSAAGRSASWWW
jgi:hypothetical protein